MKKCPSPNFNARAEGAKIDYIVLHYTGMTTAQEALKRLCDPGSEVSAHYMIDEDGEVYALVDEDKRAWHAGRGYWRGTRDVNSSSIGIEIVNPGHAFGYRPFPKQQIAALKALLRDIAARRPLSRTSFIGHSDIAPTRKQDPGELFPWRELADEGFGFWPHPAAEDYRAAQNPQEAFELLRTIGYDCPEEDEAACFEALHAFQRHYHPEALMDEVTGETLARLRTVARETGKVV